MEPKAPHANCEECTLNKMPFVPTYAPDGAEFAVIGEGPGFHEAREGVPFVGDSGKLLGITFKNAGADYEKVWRSNIVACRPPQNRDPTRKEIKCCALRLLFELEEFEGSTIIPVGKVAGDFMLDHAGYPHVTRVKDRRGHWFEYEDKKIVPTWHPAYVLRRPGEARNFYGDIRRAVKGESYHRLQEPPEERFIDDVVDLAFALTQVPEDTVVAFDLETDQVIWWDREELPGDDVLMIGISWEEHAGIIVHPDVFNDPAGKHVLNEFFARKDLTFAAHNGKFDVLFLRREGIDARCDFDTMLAHYALYEITGTHGLKQLALEYYGLEDYEAELVQRHLKSRNDYYSKVPYEDLGLYCVWDCCVTRQLVFDLTEAMKREDVFESPFQAIFMPAQKALAEVEWRGVPVDEKYVNGWREKFIDYSDKLEDTMGMLADDPTLNVRSPMQVSKVLYVDRGLPRPRVRGVKNTSTAKKAIAHIKPGQDEFVDNLRLYRRVHKMDRSYLKNILGFVSTVGRVHPSALIHGTEVGRQSFRNPAIQTIPRPYEDLYGAVVRAAFVAPPGWAFILADYSQAELRVTAILSEEPFLMGVYLDGRDLHSEVAVAMYGEDFTKAHRVLCKMFNFSYVYGGSEYSFAEDAGLPIHVARKFVRDYNSLMPRLLEWKIEQLQTARSQGYVVSPFGRRRRFPLVTQANLDDVRKASVHAPVAGTAADLTLMSLMEAESRGINVVLTVHDSIGALAPVNEAHDVAAELKQIMRDTAVHHFPQIPWVVDVDVRDRWSPLPEEIHGEAVRATFG